jgi:anionic cell wall polymer biosynthesis LytR-Cps2A-Psr (LCP) family protein
VFNPDIFRAVLNKVLLGTLFVSVFVGSALVSYFFLSYTNASPDDENEKVEQTQITQAEQELLDLETSGLDGDVEDTYNLLLLGYGGAGHDGGYLTDVIKVININLEENTATVISIPRDLWVALPIRSDKNKYFKINAAYAIGFDDRGYPLKEPKYKGVSGAARMIKNAVEEVVGMPVNNYLSIDFNGFKQAIDILGSIEVNVPVAFDDYFYPVKGLENEICGKSAEEIAELHERYSGFQLEKQFECRYEHLHFEKGMQTMDGEMVLKFVRSRHSDTHGGDFARAQRQLAVLLALKNKAFSAGALDDLPAFINQFANILKTDLNNGAVEKLLKDIPSLKEFEVRSIHLTDENVLENSKSADGQFILVPKEGLGVYTGIHSYIFKNNALE